MKMGEEVILYTWLTGPLPGEFQHSFFQNEWYLNSNQFPPSEYYSRDGFVCLLVFLSTAMIQTHT